ncbi:MAG: type II toxin-antitoxin system Phd/YefM family antitoxin [Pseudonocardiaceae bacterium]
MRELSASEVSRNFSAVLSSAEHGETIAVTRAGKRVALIAPAPRANGAALREVFRRWEGNAAFDDTFAANVAAARDAAAAALDLDPWRD